jgi:hypothetical protein
VTDNYLSGPIHLALRVAFVVLLALVIRALLHRLINRVTERATQAVLLPFRNPLPGGSVLGAVRRVPRRRPPVDEDPAVAESTLAENTVAGGRSSGRCALASRPPWTPPGSPRPLSSPEPRWSPITRHPRRRPRPGRGATVVPATIPEWIGWEAP